ncbi:HVA1 family protein [Rhodobacterales bacterium HKCCE2091]|nr:HVA1 family protein [Rhodobacterales bacterium HKCCE2091]
MIREGTKVEWDWGSGTAAGKVTASYDRKVTRTIDGTEITRDGTSDDPALVIEQDDGQKVLKLKSEVRRAD